MCGRFALTVEKEAIEDRFQIANMDDIDYVPSFNIAPSQKVLAIIHDGEKNKAGFLKWGLIPSWANQPSIGYKMINARAETLEEKPSFKKLLSRHRCLIVADSFYEWKKTENKKHPYRFLLNSSEPFAFAGLWDKWQKDEETLTTCTIITTNPNKVVENVHDRMPVILKKQDEALWLNRNVQDIALLKPLLIPYPGEEMTSYPVSDVVNSPKNNNHRCIEAL